MGEALSRSQISSQRRPLAQKKREKETPLEKWNLRSYQSEHDMAYMLVTLSSERGSFPSIPFAVHPAQRLQPVLWQSCMGRLGRCQHRTSHRQLGGILGDLGSLARPEMVDLQRSNHCRWLKKAYASPVQAHARSHLVSQPLKTNSQRMGMKYKYCITPQE